MSVSTIPAVESNAGPATDLISHFVGGQLMVGTSGRYGDVYNPALGKSTRRVAFANRNEVDAGGRPERRRLSHACSRLDSDALNRLCACCYMLSKSRNGGTATRSDSEEEMTL